MLPESLFSWALVSCFEKHPVTCVSPCWLTSIRIRILWILWQTSLCFILALLNIVFTVSDYSRIHSLVMKFSPSYYCSHLIVLRHDIWMTFSSKVTELSINFVTASQQTSYFLIFREMLSVLVSELNCFPEWVLLSERGEERSELWHRSVWVWPRDNVTTEGARGMMWRQFLVCMDL